MLGPLFLFFFFGEMYSLFRGIRRNFSQCCRRERVAGMTRKAATANQIRHQSSTPKGISALYRNDSASCTVMQHVVFYSTKSSRISLTHRCLKASWRRDVVTPVRAGCFFSLNSGESSFRQSHLVPGCLFVFKTNYLIMQNSLSKTPFCKIVAIEGFALCERSKCHN